jgi:hypothetical protein
MAADNAPVAPTMMPAMSEAAATDSGMGAAQTAIPGMETVAMAMEAAAMETTVVEATGAATVEGDRAGCHTCCQSRDRHTHEKLFSHQNLLCPIVLQYWLPTNGSRKQMVATNAQWNR